MKGKALVCLTWLMVAIAVVEAESSHYNLKPGKYHKKKLGEYGHYELEPKPEPKPRPEPEEYGHYESKPVKYGHYEKKPAEYGHYEKKPAEYGHYEKGPEEYGHYEKGGHHGGKSKHCGESYCGYGEVCTYTPKRKCRKEYSHSSYRYKTICFMYKHYYCKKPSYYPRYGSGDRKSTRLNSGHVRTSRMPSSA